MPKNSAADCAFVHPRVVLAFALCSVGVFFTMLSFVATASSGIALSAANVPGDSFFVNKQARRLSSNAKEAGPSGLLAPAAASWTVVTSPNAGGAYNFLNGVTCVSGSDCWAVGYAADSSFQTLVEHWDGNSWTIVNSPNSSATQFNFLNSVTCVSGSDCWAVGYYQSGLLTTQTLIEHWDGNSWTIISSPNADPKASNLQDVTCASVSECWAVGYYNSVGLQTLIERWDGTSWAIVNSPNGSTTLSNLLDGVTCVSGSDCWAVGYYGKACSCGSGAVSQTLIEHYTVPPLQLNAVVSRKAHGSAGTFDVDLPIIGNAGIECRSGGANGDYTLVFTFLNPLTSVDGATVTSGTGSSSSSNIDSSDAHNYIVNLTGVTNAQTITVSLSNANDSAGNSSSVVSASMAVLIGDTTADGSVNSADIAQTKSQSGQSVTSANFREDLTGDGNINSADIALAKSKSGTALP